ncbi:hypothetical protein BVC80_1495g77 [Macleaya cordata]|uniref:Uncharacterized protein n=1 Tax=Macleaya cordata TaxID=56857 RepID=A0A200PPY1_MACCD|nr:hypothetical protein BVC80_1495g77 [Macleaya cordata]
MSSTKNFYGFPYLSPPPPHYIIPFPPKVTPPPKPPTQVVSTPPPKPTTPALSAPPPSRHSIPPPSPILKPPPRPVAPSPPHIVPPSPAPSNHTTIIIVFVSLGGLFFLAFLSVALCCFMKRKKKKMVQETEIINIDEHMKVQEVIVPGPHGKQAVVLSIEEDVHIQEAIKKNERVGEGLHTKSLESSEGLHGTSSAESASRNLDVGASSSISNHQLLEHNP